jgi:hypothetical protein
MGTLRPVFLPQRILIPADFHPEDGTHAREVTKQEDQNLNVAARNGFMELGASASVSRARPNKLCISNGGLTLAQSL